MQYQLTTKQFVLTSLKRSTGRWSSSCFHLVDGEDTFGDLRRLLDQLSPVIDEVKSTSTSRANDWHEYNRLLFQMEKILRQAQAEIDHIETSAMNVEIYAMSLVKVQVRRENIVTLTLSLVCAKEYLDEDPSGPLLFSSQCNEATSSRVKEITERMQEQWKGVRARLDQLVTDETREKLVDTWRAFNHSYVYFLDRLSELETRWFVIEHDRFASTLVELDDTAKVTKSLLTPSSQRFDLQEFDERLRSIDVEMKVFEQRAETLSRHLPSIAAKKIDTQYALIEHQYSQLRVFQAKLVDQCRQRNEDVDKWKDYIQAIEQNLQVIEEHIHTNDQGLIEIDRNLQKTIDDFHQRQRIGDVDQQLEQTLINKQQQVKELIQRWNTYRTDLAGSSQRSSLSSPSLCELELTRSKTTINDDRLEKLRQDNRRLQEHSDRKTQLILEKEWNDLQKHSTVSGEHDEDSLSFSSKGKMHQQVKTPILFLLHVSVCRLLSIRNRSVDHHLSRSLRFFFDTMNSIVLSIN